MAISIRDVAGFQVGAAYCGLKNSAAQREPEDIGVVFTDAAAACSTAAVFTTNRVRAAPVKLSQRHLADAAGRCRGVVVNAGNAVTLASGGGARST